MDKVDDACKFTSRLLKQGNTVEIVSLGNIAITQLHKILATSPEPEVNTSIEFVTDGSKFQAAVKVIAPTACSLVSYPCLSYLILLTSFFQATFGALKCQNISPEVITSADTMSAIFPPPPPPPSNTSVQILPQSLMARDESSPSPTFSTVSSNGDRTTVPGTGRVQTTYSAATTSSLLNGYASSVTSSPVSSYDSEISQITGYGVPAKPETPTAQSPSMSSSQNALCAGLTSIQEYNLTQLASLADKVGLNCALYACFFFF